jgi:poly(3-hydroxybutyrate) depolymerase
VKGLATCTLVLVVLPGCEVLQRQVPADAEPSAGCGEEVYDADGSEHVIEHAGAERTFVMRLPEFYDPEFPFPVLLGLHGAGDTGAAMRDYSRLEAAADGQALFLYPDALPDDTGIARWLPADSEFLDALVDSLGAEICIDRSRVFAVGFSNGAGLANHWACLSESARGFAAMAGGPPPATCLGARAAWIGHDRGDTVVDISRGEAARTAWQAENGCDPEASTGFSPGPCERYSCDHAELAWCEDDSTVLAAHTWPDWASPSIWTFFSAI